MIELDREWHSPSFRLEEQSTKPRKIPQKRYAVCRMALYLLNGGCSMLLKHERGNEWHSKNTPKRVTMRTANALFWRHKQAKKSTTAKPEKKKWWHLYLPDIKAKLKKSENLWTINQRPSPPAFYFRCYSSTTNPVCERSVNLLVYSLSLRRHSYIGFKLAFASSIHNQTTR
jgi:hypothetical protein